MAIHDIAVIGGGAAGTIAAIRSGQLGRTTVLLEKNDRIGRKILITGNGRCNITNSASIEDFMDKFGKSGVFLRTAFFKFFNNDLLELFAARGLNFKEEEGGCMFPETGNAASVIKVLEGYLAENKIGVMYGAGVKGIKKEGTGFNLDHGYKNIIRANKVILTTGGATYRATGSTGDGFEFARALGHTILPLRPALVPLAVKELWIKEAQGLSIRDATIIFMSGKKRIISGRGEFIFTHFGISGPLVLDLSEVVAGIAEGSKEARIYIDFKPELTAELLEKELLDRFQAAGNGALKNVLKDFMPHRLADLFMELLKIEPRTMIPQVTKENRRSILRIIKELPLTVVGTLPLDRAMVTAGGVSLKEINPRTMESRIVPGLYFAGEILDCCGPSGGYNLQQAFSTGYLAGESASICAQ